MSRLALRPLIGPLAVVLLALTLGALGAPALAWNGSSRGHVQWLSATESATAAVELVVTHEPDGPTRLVGNLPLPGELGDGVLSMRIEAALLNAGKVSLPDPLATLRYTEYLNNGDLAFAAAEVRDGTLRIDTYSGGLDLAFVATLYNEDGSVWRQISYAGAPLTPLDPDDLNGDPPPETDNSGFVAAVLSPNQGCGSGYEDDRYDDPEYYDDRTRDPDDEDDSEDWNWDNTSAGSPSSGSGCEADDSDDYSDDSSGGCEGDDTSSAASETGSGCDSGGSSDAASGCGEAASGCDCGGDALANHRGRRRSALMARAVSWLPYFAVFGLLRVMRRRRLPTARASTDHGPVPDAATGEAGTQPEVIGGDDSSL